MSSIDPTRSNRDVAQGLRDVADFLDQHPELPDVRWASISLRTAGQLTDDPARETLEALAVALGDRAVEARGYSDVVEISGRFGPVTVRASASVVELTGTLPAPAYAPIIPVPPEPEFSVALDQRVAA